MNSQVNRNRTWRLYADLGNSTLHWAARQGDGWAAQGRLRTDSLEPEASARQIATAAESAGLERAACAGSVLVTSRPGWAEVGESILAQVCGKPPLVLGEDIHSELLVSYCEPAQVGQDRLAAVEGALAQFRPPVVVLGFGTCITAQAVAALGAFVVGPIAPGLQAHLAGLRRAVPHLREAIEGAASRLRSKQGPSPIGRSTAENLWIGVVAAMVGTAERLARLMRERVGAEALVIGTGGDAGLVAMHSEVMDRIDPLLVLEGLRAIDERQAGQG